MSLKLLNIRKSFGTILANDDISVEIGQGEIHGLLGENGAGKSTLVNIISGSLTSDSGTISLDGKYLDMSSPSDAIEAGIGILHQEPLVFLPFSIVDNFLAGLPKSRDFDRKLLQDDVRKISQEYGFDLDPNALASNLTVGERQQLEIARLLWMGARVLILDEPTTAISETQRENLFTTIKLLAANGMSVIFVSHKLDEIQSICDRVTVLRKGSLIDTPTLPCPTSELVNLMFGEYTQDIPQNQSVIGENLLVLDGICVKDANSVIEEVHCKFSEGEIIGLAGLEGAGQRILLRGIAGLTKCYRGRIFFKEKEITNQSYKWYMENGFHYLPADREGEGLIQGLTITEHFALAGNQSQTIDWNKAAQLAEDKLREYSIRGTVTSKPEDLSGGNQQRLLLALMPDNLSVLSMEHPTRGLDIESAEWIWKELLERSKNGTTIIFSSSDIDELINFSDRILVCFSGAIIGNLLPKETTPYEIGSLIGGIQV